MSLQRPQFMHSNKCDFKLLGFEKLHPFDNAKFSKSWKLFKNAIPAYEEYSQRIPGPIDNAALALVHSQAYLQSLKSSKNIAKIIEVGPAALVPNFILRHQLLRPMKIACQGTLMASRAALNGCMAMNFGGGFHHTYADHGEGFCVYADAALAIMQLRADQLLSEQADIVMIDLDAHRGNGFESFFINDPHVHIFDMYNAQVYPGLHDGDETSHPYMIPLKMGCAGRRYLDILKEELPKFLQSVEHPTLVFYNAGTDILDKDPLGGFQVSYPQVQERDQFVLQELRDYAVPTVLMTSGGYSADSYKLIADLGIHLFNMFKD